MLKIVIQIRNIYGGVSFVGGFQNRPQMHLPPRVEVLLARGLWTIWCQTLISLESWSFETWLQKSGNFLKSDLFFKSSKLLHVANWQLTAIWHSNGHDADTKHVFKQSSEIPWKECWRAEAGTAGCGYGFIPKFVGKQMCGAHGPFFQNNDVRTNLAVSDLWKMSMESRYRPMLQYVYT